MQNSGIDILIDWVTYKRLLIGIYYTLEVSIISIFISILLGTLFGIIRTTNSLIISCTFSIYLQIIRVLPTFVLLYILYYMLPIAFNININGRLVGVIAFSLWGTAEMSDIMRSTIISLPKHQTESSLAIGLNKIQTYRYILLPQAIKRIIPPSINLAARIIMTTSLLSIISIQELVKVGKEIIEANMFTNKMAPFWIYGLILLIFFMICYPLSVSANKLAKSYNK